MLTDDSPLRPVFFPLIFFVGFAALAVVAQIIYQWSRRIKSRQQDFIGRQSAIGRVPQPKRATFGHQLASAVMHFHSVDESKSDDMSEQGGMSKSKGDLKHDNSEATKECPPQKEDEAYSKFEQFLTSEDSPQPSPAINKTARTPRGEEEYSIFQKLVEAGATDELFACFQALKDKEE